MFHKGAACLMIRLMVRVRVGVAGTLHNLPPHGDRNMVSVREIDRLRVKDRSRAIDRFITRFGFRDTNIRVQGCLGQVY